MRRTALLIGALALGLLIPESAHAQCGGLFGRIFQRRAQARASACYSAQASACYSSQRAITYQACSVAQQEYVRVQATPQYQLPQAPSKTLPPLPSKVSPQAASEAAPPIPPDAVQLALPQPPPPEPDTPQVATTQPVVVAVVTDPYGFESHLNYYRALNGLRPVRYSANLAGWAYQNSLRGFGHAVRAGRRQNAAWGQPNAQVVAAEWYQSPGHQAAMLDPSVTEYGIALASNVWTLNLD